MSKLSILVALSVGLAGCAARAPNLPPVVPEGIETRTGHPVRPLEQRPDGALPAGVNVADGVTEEEAVAVALWNNAKLAADLASLGVAKADLIEAATWRNPTLQMLFPVGLKPFELALTYPLEVFWQRPKRMEAARKQWDQLAESLIQNGLDTARDARLAQAALLQAQERERVTREAADLGRQIAQLTEARLRAGDISDMDAETARARADMVEEQSRRAVHDTQITRARLQFAMGLTSSPDLRAVPADPAPALPPPADALRETALTTRPDLRALEVGVVAAAARAKWERSRLVTLGAILSSKEVGTSGVLSGPGVSLEIPIFRTNAGAVARADAEVEQAARRYAARRQLVDLEVSEARATLVQAIESLADWHGRVVPSLARAAEKAKLAYQAGDLSYLAALDATRQWTEAVLREIDLAAAARRAAAELDRSVGARVTRGVQP